MYMRKVTALIDTDGYDLDGVLVPMASGSSHLISERFVEYFQIHTDAFTVGDPITTTEELAAALGHSNASPAAAGNAITNATAMTAEFNTVTGADGTKGVKLKAAAANAIQVVINTDASNNLKVYPVAGSQINALGAGNAFTLTPGQMAIFVGRSTTLWYTAAATDTITGLTASAAELNATDGATAANDTTGKTAILGTNGAMTLAGALTHQVANLTSAGVGAKNGASVSVVEQGDGVLHKTILTCTETPMTFGDEAGQGQYGGVKVYDFPIGLICTFGAVIDGAVTLTAPAIDTWDGDIGLGVEAPTDHQDVANKTGQIMPKVATTQAVAKVATTDAVSVATALTESGARWRDGTSTAIDLFLSLLIDDNVAHDNTITGTFTGTITVLWANLGTTA